MKLHHLALAAGSLLLVAAAEYAWQWPIVPGTHGHGVYQVQVTEQVYRRANDPQLGDLDVLDAAGHPMPATVLAAPAQRERIRTQALPWFALPPAGQPGYDQLDVASERDADGRVLRIRARSQGRDAGPDALPRAWLLDASAVGPGDAQALELSWSTAGQPLDVHYQVLGSDDLRDWRLLQPSAPLLDLVRDGQRLLHNRIPLSGRARYLRLQPVGNDAMLQLSGVQLHVRESVHAALQWYTLPPADMEGARSEYRLDARLPVTHVDVDLRGAAAGSWRVESRDSPEDPWRLRAGPWTAYRLGEADAQRSAGPGVNGGPVRDRYWRLTASQPQSQPHALRLGYRPESVVFVAAGQPPYQLVAGSTGSRRGAAPVHSVLAQQRTRHGADWQPAPARLDEGRPRDGARALRPPPGDWNTWLLWGVLALGSVMVVVFALSLLREKRRPDDPGQV